jgi:CPA1 family monovalent cation:H+ antiporter
VLVRRHLDDPLREGGLSVLTPFMAFLLAELVHVSGVVAVVVAGLVLTYAGPRVIRARSRTQAFAFWDLATFLLNGGLFVLVGLQFHRAAENLDSESFTDALVIALAITGVVIVRRLLWVHLAAFVITPRRWRTCSSPWARVHASRQRSVAVRCSFPTSMTAA